jgi:prevent-host-death family protein
MGPINIREARKCLSKLVDAAEHGESVVITKRGREVARLVPAERKVGRRLPDLAKFRASIRVKGKPLSQTVIDLRRQERH